MQNRPAWTGDHAAGEPPKRWWHPGRPPRSTALAGWALLPLRAFLGFTFCFAGLQKLANPDFFNPNNPSGIQAQLIASARLSPLHFLLGHLLRFASPIGVVIALGELAVGIGTLLGLWTRLAAIGGALLSLTLFLTVSYHASPYYTGADIVFLFAWTPLIVAGSGGVLSLDGLIAARARFEEGRPPPNPVPVSFGLVQQICGHFEDNRCLARGGSPCAPHACPFLAADRTVDLRRPGAVERRTVVLGTAAAVGAGAVGLAVAGTAAGFGRVVGGAPQLSSPSTPTLHGGGSAGSGQSGGSGRSGQSGGSAGSGQSGAPGHGSGSTPRGTDIGAADDVPVGGWARFTDPASGDPALMLQLAKDQFLAYDAVCPHAGCTVGYSTAAKLIVCPCHGSEFEPSTGAVVAGPAPHGLRPIAVTLSTEGQLYVDG